MPDNAAALPEPLLVTIATAMRLLGDSRSAVYRAVGRGDLTMVKVGRGSRIVMTSLRARLESLPRVGRKMVESV